MNILSQIKHLMPEQRMKPYTAISLKEGDIFYGRITKLFPNQLAELNIGENKLVARLELPLRSAEGYWMQVVRNDGEVKLRLLTDSKSSEQTSSHIFQKLSLQHHAINRQLVKFIMDQQIVLPKEQFKEIGQIVQNSKEGQQTFRTLTYMLEQKLPINEAVFHVLNEELNRKTTIHDLIHYLEKTLKSNKNISETEQTILTMLEKLNKETLKWTNNQSIQMNIKTQLQSIIPALGYFYERQVMDDKINENLKIILTQYIQESEKQSSTQQIAKQIVGKMNFYQLHSLEQGPIQQIHYEIPLLLFSKQLNLTMNWEGRKTKEGKIDTDYCRVIFYLELSHLKETIVEMQIQNRVVSLNIYAGETINQDRYSPFIEQLKENLLTINYTLSHVNIQEISKRDANEKNMKMPQANYTYQKVDYRI